jgi:hypothetical protein
MPSLLIIKILEFRLDEVRDSVRDEVADLPAPRLGHLLGWGTRRVGGRQGCDPFVLCQDREQS